jgi:hypothetical protein
VENVPVGRTKRSLGTTWEVTMPAIHSEIPDENLPTRLTDPNRIVTEYESYTLIPRLGPLAYAYIQKAVWKRLKYLDLALVLVQKMQTHKSDWNVLPVVSVMNLNTAAAIGHVMASGASERIPPGRRAAEAARADAAPRLLLDTMRRLPAQSVRQLSGAVSVGSNDADMLAEREAESGQEILEELSKRNPVIDTLATQGQLFDKRGVFHNELLARDPSESLAFMAEVTRPPDANPSDLLQTVTANAVADIIKVDSAKFEQLGTVLKADSALANKVSSSIAAAMADIGIFAGLLTLNDAAIVDSREWAFLRRERVELLLYPPKFRGPLSVDPVAPNSDLTVSDSVTSGSQRIDISTSQSARSSASNVMLSTQVKEKLGTLYDYGSNLGETMSEQGYERDTSRGEKRSLVEQALSEISEANASTTVSVSTRAASSSREYVTRGKDTSFSTTEVSFEAFSPVHVTHFLQGIGVVWSPRIKNPYAALRQAIDEYEDQVRNDYITENHVIDPAEPLPTYEGFDTKSVNTGKTAGSDVYDGTYVEKTVTIKLSTQEIQQNYFLDDNVTCVLEQDDDWTTNALDSDQYTIKKPIILKYVPAEYIKIKTRLKIHDEPGGKNFYWMWLKVSVTKFKYTAAYLQQLNEYRKTVDELNPARREAVEAQAKRYARLKREELIRRYSNDPAELREYTFIALMRQMFGTTGGKWSYYHGIIKSCIDWDRAKVQPEPAPPDALAADGLSPFHFLNVDAVRFFLPIHEASEDAFFEAVSNTVDANWRALFASVKTYIAGQRNKVKVMTDRMNAADKEALTLDEYDTELVLGRHLEAVLSRTPFLES